MPPRLRRRNVVATTLAVSLMLAGAVAGQQQGQASPHAMSPSTTMAAPKAEASSSPAPSTSKNTTTTATPSTTTTTTTSSSPSSPPFPSSSSSSSTVCPSIDRSPTKHLTLVVTSSTLTLADGTPLEGMLSVNGTIVGPTLQFEDGDDVSVDVVNSIGGGQNTSIHWHGVDVPGAAWADGVTGITQNAIPDGVTFRYRFKATPVGTHWYHAHTGLQYANGLRGALIIRPKGGKGKSKSDVGAAYDEERLLLVSDQAAATAEKVLEDLESGAMSMATMQAGGAGAHGGGGGGGGMGGGGGGMGAEGGGGGGGGAMASMSPPAAAVAHGRRRGLRQMQQMQQQQQSPAMAGMEVASPSAAAAPAAAHSAAAAAAAPAAAAAAPAAAHSVGAADKNASSAAADALTDPQSGCFDKTTTQDISDAPYYATLVNGKGFALASSKKEEGNASSSSPSSSSFSPSSSSSSSSSSSPFVGSPAVITVKKGKKYRFRLINGGASWGYNISVERHPMTLLSLDGYPLAVASSSSENRKNNSKSSATVDAVVTTAGETVDFLIDATAPDGVRNYWIDVLTLTGYGGPAVLHYEGAPDPLSPAGKKQLGPPPTFRGCAYARDRSPRVADLKNATGLLFSPAGGPRPPGGPADRTLALYMTPNFAPPESGGAPPANFSDVATGFFSSFFLPSGSGNKGGETTRAKKKVPPGGGCPLLAGGKPSAYCWGTNWVTFKAPDVPAIFEGRVAGNKGGRSNSNGSTSDSAKSPLAAAAAAAGAASAAAATKGDFSDYKVPLPKNAVVDLVYINPSAMVHPMHLHGTGGWLLASGNGAPPTKSDGSVDASDKRVNLVNPPRRSTIPVPNAVPGLGDGFSVFRFVVDNVGPFPNHCHIDYHAESGMLMYFVFGGENADGTPATSTAWEIPAGLDCEAATEAARAKNATAPAPVVLNPFEDSSWSIPQLK